MLDSSSWNWTEPAEPSPGPPAQTRKFEVVHLGGAAVAASAVLAVLAVCAAGWPGAARATAGIRMAAPMAPATALTRRAVRLGGVMGGSRFWSGGAGTFKTVGQATGLRLFHDHDRVAAAVCGRSVTIMECAGCAA